MIVKTQDLDGIALDWAVAQSEQIETCGPQDFREQRKHRVQCGEFVYRWHQSWMQAGEIIQRERINVTYSDDHKRWRLATPWTAIRSTDSTAPRPWWRPCGPTWASPGAVQSRSLRS